jgi:hypothetical protein
MADEVTEPQDQFDEVVEGDIEEPQDEELEEEGSESGEQADLEAKDLKKDDTQEEEEEDTPTVESLKADLDEVKKSHAKAMYGLRQGVKERDKKIDHLTGRLSQVGEMITAAKSKKAESTTETEEEEGAIETTSGDRVYVKFDDDGNPFVDPKDLKGLSKKDIKEVENQLAKVETNQVTQAKQTQLRDDLQSVLGRDKAFPDAYGQLRDAFAFLDEALQTIVEEQDLDPKKLDLNSALDLIEGHKDSMKAFNQKYPTIDIETVVEGISLDSQGNVNKRKLRKALNAIKTEEGEETSTAEEKEEKNKTKLKTLKTIARKPSNLGSLKNQRGTAEMSLDDVAGITTEDFLEMSEADVKKLESLLKEEELRESD